MDQKAWLLARQIFERVVDMGPEKQRTYVDQACGEDQSLKLAVLALLRHDTEEEDSFEPAIVGLSRSSDDVIEDYSRVDQIIGPYRLVKGIGRGGMGEVYLADRIDGRLQNKVAIKFLRLEDHARQRVRRFQTEQQILANLKHPNIARLIDVGIDADQVPFLVMEFIDGQPILEYCDSRNLNLSARLHLFEQVCEAVQYAHRNLIIHRDIKSKNILVTQEGIPKLLDFGIAKLIGPVPGLAAGEETQTGMRALTPYHASPEQLLGKVVTTVSDVYALGLLLYELLCGFRPYKADNPLTLLEQIIKIDPEPPSFRLPMSQRKGGEACVDIAMVRGGLTPRQLKRQLSGDLDAVVSMALAKKPENRYPSVESFLEELRRLREGLPIRARPAGHLYRIGKFVHRHALKVAMGVIFVIAVTGGIGTTIYQSAKAKEERKRAFQEMRKAEEVARFLVEAFNQYDPSLNPGERLSTKQILVRAVSRLQPNLNQQPSLQASLLNTIAGVLCSLGHYVEAKPILDEAWSINDRTTPQQDLLTTAAIHTNFGHMHMGLANYNDALAQFRDALDLLRSRQGVDPSLQLEALRNLADAYYHLAGYDQAKLLLHEAHGLEDRMPGHHLWRIGRVLNQLGLIYADEGKFTQSNQTLNKALDIYEQALPQHHPEVAVALHNLGHLKMHMGEPEEAEKYYRPAIENQSINLGESHLLVLRYKRNLALCLQALGRFDEAVELQTQVLEEQRKTLANDHVEISRSINNIAFFTMLKGDFPGAEAIFREGLEDMRLTTATEAELAPYFLQYGAVLIHNGKLDQAEIALNRALAIYREAVGLNHAHVGVTKTLLAELQVKRGDYQKAFDLASEAQAVFFEQENYNLSRISFAENVLGMTLAALGKCEEGQPIIERSFQDVLQEKGEGSMFALLALDRMIFFYEACGDVDKLAAYREQKRIQFPNH